MSVKCIVTKEGCVILKRIGDLAELIAKRSDIALVVYKGSATVYLGDGPERKNITVDCQDNRNIYRLIMSLTYGKFRSQKKGVA